MSQEQNPAAALSALLDERNRYEGWIAALQSRKASTPASVYERVYTDYVQRLDVVVGRLTQHTGELQSASDTLGSQLSELRAREADRIEARHEVELRAAVGEFSEAEWQARSADADREIAEIAEERRAAEARLSELRNVLALTTAPRASDADAEKQADGAPAGASPGAASLAEAVETAHAAEQMAEPIAAEPVAPEPQPAPAPPSSSPPPPPSPSPRTDRIPFKPRVQGWPDQAPQVSEMYDGGSATLRQSAPADAAAPAPAPAAASAAPSSAPAASSGPGKSLQCPECGAANSATEWYCERCGGELAAL